jgi:asparagine synthase (glutamine-hydrolysing)
MVHRGPDDEGYFTAGHVGMGFRRLSIIDLQGGHQPMTNEDGTVVIVFNGEIYNYQDLHAELVRRGHRFQTRSDTEAIIHAYEEYGADCVRKLRGMFAFAIYDQKTQQMLLARDRLGKKPLYYYVDDRVFLFASEIKALLATGLVPARINTPVLDFYLRLGYVPGPATLFRDVVKLQPGHSLLTDGQGASPVPYWSLNGIQPFRGSYAEAKARLLELLEESIRLRLMSDVPLGVFLSGGVDSSAVTAIMARLMDRPVKTFSVGYEGAEEVNELPYAKRVASAFRTDHHEFLLTPDDFFKSLEMLLAFLEEPIADGSAIAQYRLAQVAKPEATVLLCGEGADELFAGYPLYLTLQRVSRLRPFFRLGSPTRLARLGQDLGLAERTVKYLDWLCRPFEESYHTVSCEVTPTLAEAIYSDELQAAADGHLNSYFAGRYDDLAGLSELGKILRLDTLTWIPDRLLLKADKMTMAASVELRLPFLDHDLVEFAMSLPDEYKLQRGDGKVILKDVLKEILPPEILHRPKRGFVTPTTRWFRGELFRPTQDILLDPGALARGYFRPGYVERILTRHRSGREDLGRRILSLLILELWHRMYLGGA